MMTADLAGFLTGSVDIHMGTRDAGMCPHSVRVSAIRVEPDGEHVIAFIPAVGLDAVLPDLEVNGQAALVAARPPDHRTYQLKGTFADVRRARRHERAFIEQFWRSFLDSLHAIGIDPALFAAWPVWPAMAVRIRVTAVFSQTPGPGAGAPVA